MVCGVRMLWERPLWRYVDDVVSTVCDMEILMHGLSAACVLVRLTYAYSYGRADSASQGYKGLVFSRDTSLHAVLSFAVAPTHQFQHFGKMKYIASFITVVGLSQLISGTPLIAKDDTTLSIVSPNSAVSWYVARVEIVSFISLIKHSGIKAALPSSHGTQATM